MRKREGSQYASFSLELLFFLSSHVCFAISHFMLSLQGIYLRRNHRQQNKSASSCSINRVLSSLFPDIPSTSVITCLFSWHVHDFNDDLEETLFTDWCWRCLPFLGALEGRCHASRMHLECIWNASGMRSRFSTLSFFASCEGQSKV